MFFLDGKKEKFYKISPILSLNYTALNNNR